ncbi:MAG: ECF-type sigma factor [Gemmataceae bacterium]|nr:ECF-type sigma factor [Gemmataceae bacterium]MCI0743071.1 ECF-type sigma factor [Gemmataceae bacterium]
MAENSNITRVLDAISQGHAHAAEELLPLVYEELRKLAAQRLAQEKPGQTLQATALVHEAYLRLTADSTARLEREAGEARRWDSRGHFFAAAAEAMRRILVEQARRKRRARHGGELQRVELRENTVTFSPDDEQLLFLDEALTKLAALRPQASKLVQLRFFSGLAVEEAAPVLGISTRTARRLWVFARAWLRREMQALADRNPS